MSNELVEEELVGSDRLAAFHPTKPNDVLNDQFRTIAKLGFGSGSTVWLAENLKFHSAAMLDRYVTIKISAIDTDAIGEVECSKIICDTNPLHEGRSHIRTPLYQFDLDGSKGSHSCLVYKVMREPLGQFQYKLRELKVPVPLFKIYIYCLLKALDYLHNDCRIVHTDIKDDNIMMTFEPEFDLGVYIASLGYGQLPKLADFDQALPRPEGDRGHLLPIQSHRFRAPEVLLGCPWTHSVDIWNLGVLMWKMLENINLFDRPGGEDRPYDAHVHLAQRVNLLGRPPQELVKRERASRDLRLDKPILGQNRKECKNTNEYYGGPFFDENGQIFRTDLLEDDKGLACTIAELDGDEKDAFLDFALKMLQWLPEQRLSAGELLEHKFLEPVRQYRDESMKNTVSGS
ncbi:hypothetical protein ED733_002071 [Metarhizium rileyi]|uniref:non-specific serine/threonine protein kinase n=1 Tax=Metarhizium rileyi (strain RCEF 4871) TaxID=1649241 RepID=A0A5C6G2V0_METRR|nr:hypothetical protein ED733_002071 [Metarhizium rileyi]